MIKVHFKPQWCSLMSKILSLYKKVIRENKFPFLPFGISSQDMRIQAWLILKVSEPYTKSVKEIFVELNERRCSRFVFFSVCVAVGANPHCQRQPSATWGLRQNLYVYHSPAPHGNSEDFNAWGFCLSISVCLPSPHLGFIQYGGNSSFYFPESLFPSWNRPSE